MNTENLFLWVPGEAETGFVAALPSDSGIGREGTGTPSERLEAVLSGFGEAEKWAKAHAEAFADAPEAIERLRYVPLREDAVFTRGVGAIVRDEPLENLPSLECTGQGFEPGAVQVLTGAEVDALLRLDLDEDARDWPGIGSGGLDGARMCMTFYPDGAGSVDCGLEFSAASPDNPGVWTYAAYVPLNEIQNALAPVLQSMKEAEGEAPAP